MITKLESNIIDDLKSKFSRSIDEISFQRDRRIYMKIKRREDLIRICKYLRSELGFDLVSCISGVDYIDRFCVVYSIWSTNKKCLLTISVDIPKEQPTIQSISNIWGGANWHEREAYDLLGIVFENHPNLERLLLSEDWTYHPLRKDFRYPFDKERAESD